MEGRVWKAVLGGMAVTVLALGTVLAGDNEGGKAPEGGGGRRGAGWGQGARRPGRERSSLPALSNENLRKERERFQQAMKPLDEQAAALRKKVEDAIKQVHQGEGKPTPEMIAEAVKPFEAEAKALAAKVVDESVLHNENALAIIKAEKEEVIQRMASLLLLPQIGPRAGRGGGPGQEGQDQGGGKKGAEGNAGHQPEALDLEIEVAK